MADLYGPGAEASRRAMIPVGHNNSAGGALQEFYGTKARMKKFAVHVRVDVVGASPTEPLRAEACAELN